LLYSVVNFEYAGESKKIILKITGFALLFGFLRNREEAFLKKLEPRGVDKVHPHLKKSFESSSLY